MMKLNELHAAQKIAVDRSELATLITAIEKSTSFLGVTFNGQYQRDDILEAVRPVIVKHLTNRLWRLDEQLKELGVDPHG